MSTYRDFRVPESQIGQGIANDFALNSDFFLQQLAVPKQLSDALPGSGATFGREAVSNKALADTGPSADMTSEWEVQDLRESSDKGLEIEKFFAPETHGNDTNYALSRGHMPTPAVHYYGQTNEERYPIYGMNANARNMVLSTGYPKGTSKWGDDTNMVSNASTELENLRRQAQGKALNATFPQEVMAGVISSESDIAALHATAAMEWTHGSSMEENQGEAPLRNLPGGKAADALSQAYHTLASIEESPYYGDSSQLVHSTLLDIRDGKSTDPNTLLASPFVSGPASQATEALSR
jgi:hypothetical protein